MIAFSFVKDVLLYTGGTVIGRIITLFLLPLTTGYLNPEDYGIIAMLTLAITLLNGLSTLGFHTSLGRIVSNEKSRSEKQRVIWTAFFSLVANNMFLAFGGYFFARPLSTLLLGTESYGQLISIALISLSVSSIRMPFEYYLRSEGRSKTVFCLNLADVVFSIMVMLTEVVILKRGARGYIEASAISQGLNLLIMLAFGAPRLRLSINWKAMSDLIKLGAPCIFGAVCYCILQGSSRYILQLYSTEEQVGFYFLGSNIGKVIELPLWGFMSAWVPLFNSYVHKRSEAPALFSQVMSYYLTGMACLIAPLFCFARSLVEVMMHPQFNSVWTVVGLSAISHVLWGAYAISYPPLIFAKRTGIQTAMEIGAGILCILLNLLFVPLFHKEGAALATCLSFLGLLLLSVWINRRFLYVAYETKKITKIVCPLAIIGLFSFFPVKELWVYNSFMILLLVAFYGYIWSYLLTVEEKSSFRRKLFLTPISTS